jgi:hypothetical protein
MPIRSIVTDEQVRGIVDEHSRKELKVNSICRQIFEKYGYQPLRFMNHDTALFPLGSSLHDDTDYGIDDIIYCKDIPKEDTLKLKQRRPLVMNSKYHLRYNIDYKSNTFKSGLGSVYVKLMPFYGYSHYKRNNGHSGKNTINTYHRLDQKGAKRERKLNKSSKGRIEKYYGNNQLLGSKNSTDYFFYQRSDELEDEEETLELIEAYLVPANPLRFQVISILNEILKKGGFKEMPFKKGDFFLNHNIVRALKICEDTPELVKPGILKPPMDLFRPHPRKKEVHLRIPEEYLTPHIKFDAEGEIIN